jgi:amino acid efflux transporter
MGGPASLIAWAALGILGLTLAWTFAAAGAEYPDAGGVQAMIERVFGRMSGTLTRWLIFFSVPAGAVAASHIFANHLVAAFSIPVSYTPWLAWGCWFLVTLVNYVGIRVSATAQLVLSGVLILFLTAFIVFGFPSVKIQHFVPFAPFGLRGIGESAVLIFWSFLGWEAVAHLAEEFHDPKKDMFRAAVVAAVIVGVFYFLVAFVLIGVGVLHESGESGAPLVALAETLAGRSGRLFTGIVAAVVCFGTMNAYMAGLSRLGYAMARDGDLPKWLGRLDAKTGTPKRSLLFLFGMNSVALAIQAFFQLPMRLFFLIPNVAFLVLYVLGCLSVARLLRRERWAMIAAYFSATICASMLPFASTVLFYPCLVVICALAYTAARRRVGMQP